MCDILDKVITEMQFASDICTLNENSGTAGQDVHISYIRGWQAQLRLVQIRQSSIEDKKLVDSIAASQQPSCLLPPNCK